MKKRLNRKRSKTDIGSMFLVIIRIIIIIYLCSLQGKPSHVNKLKSKSFISHKKALVIRIVAVLWG